MYLMILNRFYSMKLFQEICSSVISAKGDFFANYDDKTPDEMGKFSFQWIFWTILHKFPSELFYFAEKRSFSKHYSTCVTSFSNAPK